MPILVTTLREVAREIVVGDRGKGFKIIAESGETPRAFVMAMNTYALKLQDAGARPENLEIIRHLRKAVPIIGGLTAIDPSSRASVPPAPTAGSNTTTYLLIGGGLVVAYLLFR